MKSYELTYIIAGDQSEDVKGTQKKVLDLVIKNQGKVLKEDLLGKKPLAYSIKKQDYGFYILNLFDLPPEKLAIIENELKLIEEVIRHLITKKEPAKSKAKIIKKEKKEIIKKVTSIKKSEQKELKIKPKEAKIEKPKVESSKKIEQPKIEKPKIVKPKKDTKEGIIKEKEREDVLDKKLEEILKEE